MSTWSFSQVITGVVVTALGMSTAATAVPASVAHGPPGHGGLAASVVQPAPSLAPPGGLTPDPSPDLGEGLDGDLAATWDALDTELESEPVVPGILTSDAILVPFDATTGIEVPTSGDDTESLGIGLPFDGRAERTDGGAVTYGDDDTGVFVHAIDTTDLDGIETALRALVVVTGPDSPTRFTFPLDLPEGTRATLDASGAVVVADAGGDALGVFAPPWAVDADGADVPTGFALEGSTLVQHVDHGGATYPVIADPVWFVPVLFAGARVAVQVVVRASTQAGAKKAAAAARASARKVAAIRTATVARAKSFTQGNYRHNLIVRTAMNPLQCQAHHTMPRRFKDKFEAVKINIHEPKYLLWWISTPGFPNNHQSMAGLYNSGWNRFFQEHERSKKSPTRAQVLHKRALMVNEYRKYYKC